jgi:hypothetical protein
MDFLVHIILQILNAFCYLGHWGCIYIVKVTESEYIIKKKLFTYALCSAVYVSNTATLSVSPKMSGKSLSELRHLSVK